jgi:hypothetical protein
MLIGLLASQAQEVFKPLNFNAKAGSGSADVEQLESVPGDRKRLEGKTVDA